MSYQQFAFLNDTNIIIEQKLIFELNYFIDVKIKLLILFKRKEENIIWSYS